MNNYEISLQSTTSSSIQTLDEIEILDYSEISLNLENLFKKVIPIFLTIDWGDGTKETFDNDLYKQVSKQELNIFNMNPLFTKKYKHEFFPSETSLYKQFQIQVLLFYSNLEYSIFTIPVKIRTLEYFESLYDIKIKDVNIIPENNNPKRYHFESVLDNQIFEMVDEY